MKQIVRGNYELSVAGQMNLNGSEEIQARAGKIRIESNVESINLKSSKKINIQSGEVINIRSGQGILQQAVGDVNIKSANIFIQGAGEANFKGETVKIGGGGNASISADTVAIDDEIHLAMTEAVPPEDALPAFPAEGTDMPEPASKSAGNGNGGGGGFASGGYSSPSLSGSGGYISQDDGTSDGSQIPGFQVEGNFVAGDYANIEEALRAQGFTEKEIVAALAIIGGESNGAFTATEASYSGTSNDRIRSIFEKTRSLSDSELTALKSNDTEFFNYVYGGKLGNGLGNNDGYDYRGRGLIQLTFKSNYERYAKLTGYDIVNNPSLVNTDRQVGAAVTAAYLKDRVRRTGDPVGDIRAAVAGTRTGLAYTMNIDKDRTRYERLLKERGIS